MPSEAAETGRGKLSTGSVAAGIVCSVGLLLFSAMLAQSGSWFLMHDSPVLFLLGLAFLACAPLWLLSALISAVVNRRVPWRPAEIGATLAVLLGLLAVAFTLS